MDDFWREKSKERNNLINMWLDKKIQFYKINQQYGINPGEPITDTTKLKVF